MIVFHETHEDTGEDPCHRHLVQVVLPPDLISLGGSSALLDLCERLPQSGVHLGVPGCTDEEILVQFLDKFLQIRQECLDVDHD